MSQEFPITFSLKIQCGELIAVVKNSIESCCQDQAFTKLAVGELQGNKLEGNIYLGHKAFTLTLLYNIYS